MQFSAYTLNRKIRRENNCDKEYDLPIIEVGKAIKLIFYHQNIWCFLLFILLVKINIENFQDIPTKLLSKAEQNPQSVK